METGVSGQQRDSLFLQLEFFVFYGATWASQDCARPAIASDFFRFSAFSSG